MLKHSGYIQCGIEFECVENHKLAMHEATRRAGKVKGNKFSLEDFNRRALVSIAEEAHTTSAVSIVI